MRLDEVRKNSSGTVLANNPHSKRDFFPQYFIRCLRRKMTIKVGPRDIYWVGLLDQRSCHTRATLTAFVHCYLLLFCRYEDVLYIDDGEDEEGDPYVPDVLKDNTTHRDLST